VGKFHRLSLLLLLFLSVQGQAQYYSIGADPASVKWNQTRVLEFNLLYPAKEQGLAARYRQILSDIALPVTASMQAEIRNIPVIIHPYVSFSNGSSILAPRRMELFPKQPLALETNDFAPQLVIHEARHFAQMERLNDGVTRIAGYLMGEQAQSIVLGLHVPNWLLEGDAVLTETLLSNAGRGRIAGFIQPLRSRLVNDKDLAYDRVLFGSYIESLPDDYLIGYFLTARGRMLADPLLWSDALGQIGSNPFMIKGIAGLTRPKTGFTFSKLYVETLNWLRDYWTDPSLAVKAPAALFAFAADSEAYMNYYRPQQFSDHEVICLKKSMGDIPAFVILDTSGHERIIARPGTMEDAGFSYNNGKLVWSELIQDIRWENRSWSDLFIYDFENDQTTRLTSSQRYFSPVFSSDGENISVIDEQADGSSFIRIIRAKDGSVLHTADAPPGEHYSYLCYGKDQDELFAITTGEKGRKLVKINVGETSPEVILAPGFTDIKCPAMHGDWIYFTGPAGATQGLYRMNRIDRVLELVFQHPEGINYLTAQNGELFLSAYTTSGYRPVKVSIDRLSGRIIDAIEPLTEPVTEIIQRAQGEFPVTISDTVMNLKTSKYRKISHLFKLHSWSPVFVNPDSYQVSPGIVLMSQNDLSTLTAWTGYQRDKTDRSHNFLASMTYTGLFPSLKFDYSRKYRTPDTDDPSVVRRSYHFPGSYSEFFKVESGVPLDFSSGAWYRRVEPALFFEYARDWFGHKSELNASAWMSGISLSTSLTRKLSYRDLFPKWGVKANLSYFQAYSDTRLGNNKKARLLVYLPGLLPNSSLRVLNSISWLTFNQFLNSTQDYPRGQYVYEASDRFNLKVDYAFPISYPDYHLSWLIYVKRIKANLFYDAGTGIHEKKWFMTTGADLTIDYHIIRIGIELESGIRMMYFPNTGKFGAEFLWGFSVN